jgi:hypothetical protein
MERFACAYCGTEHIVKRGAGVISLAPVVEGLRKVEIGVDRTASELALKRLKEEIFEIEGRINLIRNSNYPNSFFQALAAFSVVVGGLLTLVYLPITLTDTTSPPGYLLTSGSVGMELAVVDI